MLRTSLKFSLFVLALAPLACGGDGDQNDDNNNDSTGGDDDDDDDDDDSGTDPDADATDPDADADATDPDATATDTSATDPDTGSTDATAESSTGDECTPDDDCDADDDCLPGQTCLGCICFGEPTGCAEYGDGVFGDCVATGSADVCEADGAGCVAAEDVGICFFPCEEECDCPAPPAGFEALLECEDVVTTDGSECFLECTGGVECPEGMFCFQNKICFYGEEPAGLPPYGDCQNNDGQCEGGTCVSGGTFAVCATPCEDVSECPEAPDTGDATLTCANITDGDDDPECWLSCGDGETCPDGMDCYMDFICVWNEMMPPPPYNDCSTDPLACLDGESCIDDGSGGICSEPDCMDAGDCPDAPDTGDAPVACGDVDGSGNVCYLDCSGDETCPDGMACSDGGYCHFEG